MNPYFRPIIDPKSQFINPPGKELFKYSRGVNRLEADIDPIATLNDELYKAIIGKKELIVTIIYHVKGVRAFYVERIYVSEKVYNFDVMISHVNSKSVVFDFTRRPIPAGFGYYTRCDGIMFRRKNDKNVLFTFHRLLPDGNSNVKLDSTITTKLEIHTVNSVSNVDSVRLIDTITVRQLDRDKLNAESLRFYGDAEDEKVEDENKKLNKYNMVVIGKYLHELKDYLNVALTNKEFRDFYTLYHFNPIVIDDKKKYVIFEQMETIHIYDSDFNPYYNRGHYYPIGNQIKSFLSNKNIKMVIVHRSISGEELRKIHDSLENTEEKYKGKKLVFKKIESDERMDLKDLMTRESLRKLKKRDDDTIKYRDNKMKKNVEIRIDDYIPLGELVDLEVETFQTNVSEIPRDENNFLTDLTDCIVKELSFYYNNARVTAIKLPTQIESLGESLFFRSGELTSITIPPNVKTIGPKCFAYCSGLVQMQLPRGLEEIGQFAFAECKSLTGINIPNTLTQIGRSCFYGCTKLSSIEIELRDTNYFMIKNNFLIQNTNIGKIRKGNEEGDAIFYIPGYHTTMLHNINIPSEVTGIGMNLFNRATNCTSINIPQTVRRVGPLAFSLCIRLREIDLPCTIYNSTSLFEMCSSLTRVKIPNTWTCLYEGTFRKCHSLVKVEGTENIQFVGLEAFKECIELRDIDFPKFVACNNSSFESCIKLRKVFYNREVIRYRSYRECACLSRLDIPNGVLVIEKEAFESCINVVEIHLPTTLQRLRTECFLGCGSLTGIVIPKSVTYMDKGCFKACYKLGYADIQANIKELPNETFENCQKLSRVDINCPRLLEIGSCCFINCSELAEINIPSTVTMIRDRAFYSCYKLPKIGNMNSLIRIECNAFGYSGLPELDLPDNVTFIGQDCFYNCSDLSRIKLSDSLTKIPRNCFMKNRLRSVVIPSAVSLIGVNAFDQCTVMTHVELPVNLKKILPYAFYMNVLLKDVTIPNNVEFIGMRAFARCCTLTRIVIPGSVRKLSAYCFHGCGCVKEVVFDQHCDVKYLPSSCFIDCNELENIVFPNNLLLIGDDCFKGCSSLVSVDLPDQLRLLYTNAFRGTGIQRIRIPPNVFMIRTGCFEKGVRIYFRDQEIQVTTLNNGFFCIQGQLVEKGKRETNDFYYEHHELVIRDITNEFWKLNSIMTNKNDDEDGTIKTMYCDDIDDDEIDPTDKDDYNIFGFN